MGCDFLFVCLSLIVVCVWGVAHLQSFLSWVKIVINRGAFGGGRPYGGCVVGWDLTQRRKVAKGEKRVWHAKPVQ